MPGRLPTKDDFPPSLTLSIVPPPKNQSPTNVLILLHGIGDTHDSFTHLGRQMALPETVCISIRGLEPIGHGLDGYHWGDDLLISPQTGTIDPDAKFNRACRTLAQTIIRDTLIQTCAYQPRDIFLFGYGQGAYLALEAATFVQELLPSSPAANALGGVVSIGGVLPSMAPRSLDPKCRTPILVCAGELGLGSQVVSSAEGVLRDVFEEVEVVRWEGRMGDPMPGNREEMVVVMRFFGRRLRSLAGVPKGAVEVT